MPKRIQRRRVKGWKMPPNTVYVGRPTKWGNPYMLSGLRPALDFSRQGCVDAFRKWVEACNSRSTIDADRIRRELGGRDLACWCPLDKPCHADVLLEIANSQEK